MSDEGLAPGKRLSEIRQQQGTVVLESVIRLPVWLAVDLHLLLPLHSSLTLPGTGIASPFICWLDA